MVLDSSTFKSSAWLKLLALIESYDRAPFPIQSFVFNQVMQTLCNFMRQFQSQIDLSDCEAQLRRVDASLYILAHPIEEGLPYQVISFGSSARLPFYMHCVLTKSSQRLQAERLDCGFINAADNLAKLKQCGYLQVTHT